MLRNYLPIALRNFRRQKLFSLLNNALTSWNDLPDGRLKSLVFGLITVNRRGRAGVTL